MIKVGFIVRKHTAYRKTEFHRRQRTLMGGHAVWVTTLEDLLRDVRGLVGSGRALDRAYLERWAADLGIMELWREVQTR